MSDYMHEEVVVQILLRLPAKQLSELRCVCKLWNSLIKDSNFISRYTQFAINNAANNSNKLILRHYERLNCQEKFTLHHDDGNSFIQIKEFDFPYEDKHDSNNVIGTCCGLVCLLDNHQKGWSKSVILWNPSLESCVRIMFKFTANNFDTIHGFGFDPKTIDYKVVRIVCRKNFIAGMRCPVRPVVQVFALKVGSWKTVPVEASTPCAVTVKSPQAYVNGGLHWVGYNEQSDAVRERFEHRLVLLAFDISEEVFKKLNMPDEVKTRNEFTFEREHKLFVGVLDQKLALMRYYTQWHNSPSYDRCCIWMMNEYGVAESWTKQFKIDLRLGLGKVAGLRKNGDMLLVTRYNEELVSFNTVDRKIQRLGIYGDTWSFYLDTYMESLVLMQRIDGVSRIMPRPSIATCERALCREASGVETTDKGI